MTKTNHKRAALLDEHAKLLNDGFPEPMTKDFWDKVEELEPNEQQEIRKLFQLAEELKTKWSYRDR